MKKQKDLLREVSFIDYIFSLKELDLVKKDEICQMYIRDIKKRTDETAKRYTDLLSILFPEKKL